ncbi:MAG TPA: hypothetical protein VMV66_03160 [Candidatus Humimicrobiaceae bacterium]|nr:hypothetical protein [Candidatus Humimicrobiaceae bacterium]
MATAKVEVKLEDILKQWLKEIKGSGGFTDATGNPANFWAWAEEKGIEASQEEVSVALTELIKQGEVRVFVEDIGGTWFELVQ